MDPTCGSMAGQPVNYLIKVMKDYRSGERKDWTMNAQSKNLSDEEIDLLAKYYSSQQRY